MDKILKKYDRQTTRILEIIPGLFSWSLIAFPLMGSFFIPEVVAYFIILFNIYFFFKAAHLGINSVRSYRRIRMSEKINWYEKGKAEKLDIDKVNHILIIPVSTEPYSILERTLKHLAGQELPTKNIFLCIATEERSPAGEGHAQKLKEEFGQLFGRFWITKHQLVAGEIVGKSSNMAFAARYIQNELMKDNTNKDLLTLTSCDSDVALHPKYFSNLAYKFLKNEERYNTFWQGALVFYNNIWRVPVPVRVVNTIYSIAQIADLMRPASMFNYSTYSASWKMIEKAGFWDVDVISEDWHLFFKSFFSHNGKINLEPIFLPLLADAAEGHNYWQSLKSLYSQNRRWAWGATDIAYAIKEFISHPRVEKQNFFFRFLRALEQHILWPVNWWLLTLGATVPPLVNESFKNTVLGHNLPVFSGLILTTSTIFMVSVITIDWLLRPPRPIDYQKRYLPSNILQYLLMPITSFLFNALPGMEAHTRLILGKRLEYRPTEKIG